MFSWVTEPTLMKASLVRSIAPRSSTPTRYMRVAQETIRDVDASAHWPGKTVTKISEAVVFWEMGPEGQDYFLRFPHGCKAPFPRQDDRSENRPTFA